MSLPVLLGLRCCECRLPQGVGTHRCGTPIGNLARFGVTCVPSQPTTTGGFPLRGQRRVSIAGLPRRSFASISELAVIVNTTIRVFATCTFETDESTPGSLPC